MYKLTQIHEKNIATPSKQNQHTESQNFKETPTR